MAIGLIIIGAIFVIQKNTNLQILKTGPVEEKIGVCTREHPVAIDLDKSLYSEKDITKVVGTINNSNIKTLEYDLVRYKGASDLIMEFDVIKPNDKPGGVYDPAPDYHVGWEKINVNLSKNPAEFSFEPKFPDKFQKDYLLGIYFRATCKDGSVGRLTRIFIQKGSNFNLYAVGSNNPNKARYFK